MSTLRHINAKKDGYSLVEISLAMLVIGVGLLAALALFPEGLGAARRAVEDVSIAIFAENVFAGLALDAGDANIDWDIEFRSGLRLMKSHSLGGAVNDSQLLVQVLPNADSVTNYFWIPDYYSDSLEEHKTAIFTYSLTIGDAPGGSPAKYARLEVWPGEYPAGQKPPGRGRIFYREFLPIR
jgi:prepilin-type N-terminal cleavage/methylation domain-containing protein